MLQCLHIVVDTVSLNGAVWTDGLACTASSASIAVHEWLADGTEGWCNAECLLVLLLYSIVYGSTKGFASYGGFTHVGFPLRMSVSPPTLYQSSLQQPLSPLSPSPVTTFPSSSSAVVN